MSSINNIAQILENTLSPDPQIRQNATNYLEQASSHNYSAYLTALLDELATEGRPEHIRTTAGIAFKNSLSVKDPERRQSLSQRWIALDASTKAAIKSKSLAALSASSNAVGTAAAQVVQSIAFVELPLDQWPELMTNLLQNLASPSSSINLKRSTLEAIGFICEEINPQVLVSRCNEILSAVINGLQQDSDVIRIAAAQTLLLSLQFVKEGFEDEKGRQFIMSVVCSACCSGNNRVVVVVLECIIRILQLYYDKMEPFMETGLFPITVQHLSSPDADVAMQAIEFWSTVCEIEASLEAGAAEQNEDEFQGFSFAVKSLPYVIPHILQLMIRTGSEEDANEEDEDEWNVPMAASTCLSLWAEVARDAIITEGKVGQFIESGICSSEWRLKEAAVMSFGCIMSGPSVGALAPIVQGGTPVLMGLMADCSLPVRDAAAWALGRVCEHALVTLQKETILSVIECFCNGLLHSPPRVGSQCAWGLSNVANYCAFDDEEDAGGHGGEYQEALLSSLLTPKMEQILVALTSAIAHPESMHFNLKAIAYESMVASVSACNLKECSSLLEGLCHSVLSQLHISAERAGAGGEISDNEAHLCVLLQALIKKFGPSIRPQSQLIMNIFHQLLAGGNAKSVYIFEDIFMAIGTLVASLGADFEPLLPEFMPFLFKALGNYPEIQLCSIALGLIGDLSRSLHKKLAPWAEQIVQQLFDLLKANSPPINQTLIPPIVNCFGDLALGLEEHFLPFFPATINLLAQVSTQSMPPVAAGASQHLSPETIDFFNELRVSILEALTCLIQGAKATGNANAFVPHISSILEFVQAVSRDKELSEEAVKAAIALVGDIADSLASESIRPVFEVNRWVLDFCATYKGDKRFSHGLRKIASWAYSVILPLYQ